MLMLSADCFNQSATPLGKQVASHLLRLTTFVFRCRRIACVFIFLFLMLSGYHVLSLLFFVVEVPDGDSHPERK